MRLVLMIAAVAALMAATATPARSHGEADWVQQGGYKNAVGELCCGERDCGVQVGGRITPVPGGYRVNAEFRIGTGETATVIHVEEFVPDSEASPSPDGSYWRCQWGGMRKCFFFPPPSY